MADRHYNSDWEDEFGRLEEAMPEEKEHVAMRDITTDDRPREKLLKMGAEKLSRAELLAILIGSGSTRQNATELMTDIISDCGGQLMNLDHMSIEELMSYNGIGLAKAVTIKAALELGNRRVNETMTTAKTFNNAETTYRFMKHKIANLTHEECWALMLNNKSRLLKLARLSQGGRTSTLVDVRILLKQAIMAEAICVILVHNHPSGGLSPSRDDDRLTESVKSALQAVSIQLLDHVIIADGGYYSYVENGRL